MWYDHILIRNILTWSLPFVHRAEGQPSIKKGVDCTKLVVDGLTKSEQKDTWNFVWTSAECYEIDNQRMSICNAYTNEDSGMET